MATSENNQPSTSRNSSPPLKKIKIEDEADENLPDVCRGIEDIKEEIKEELIEEEVVIKDEIKEEEQGTSGESQNTIGTQTNDSDEMREISDEAIERLLAQVRPKKQTVSGTKVIIPPKHLLQFNITLLRGKKAPKIWRRFKVPADYNFRQFHIAIQKTMGWKSVEYDYHLHAFRVLNPTTGYVDAIVMTEDVSLYSNSKDENVAKIKDYFTIKNHKGKYQYDFGCDWEHEVIFEEVCEPVDGETYPKCIAGAKACPPEDGVVHSDEEYDSDEFDAEKCF